MSEQILQRPLGPGGGILSYISQIGIRHRSCPFRERSLPFLRHLIFSVSIKKKKKIPTQGSNADFRIPNLSELTTTLPHPSAKIRENLSTYQRVWFWRRFGLKTGRDFSHFRLESGMVYNWTSVVYECVRRFNYKWLRKKEIFLLAF